jgi:hypothetical protein
MNQHTLHSTTQRRHSVMKNIAARTTAGLIILLLVTSGCQKKETATSPTGNTTGGTASFTLNGAGFSNQTFNIVGVVGGYSVSDHMTGLVGSAMSSGDTTHLTIVFPGSSTGTFQFSDTVGVIISRGSGSSAHAFINGIGGGQIAVTAYGGVGGNIIGSFSGRLYDVSLTGLDSVTVSNGSFNALRMPNE